MVAVQSLNDVLRLRGDGDSGDAFVAPSVFMEGGRIYGGQVVGQTCAAASLTVDPARRLHSFHGYFLRAGDVTRPVELGVERFRDGRSFSSRSIRVTQGESTIFSGLASFHLPEEGVEHEVPTPPVRSLPQPEDLVDRFPDGLSHPGAVAVAEDLMQVRDIPPGEHPGLEPGSTASWIRVRHPLADDPALHRAAIGYLSDAIVQDPILVDHDLSWDDHGTSMASLDHSVWWYRDGRADDWMLTVQTSPIARGGRGLAVGRIHARDGSLLAAVTQEMLLRVRPMG